MNEKTMMNDRFQPMNDEKNEWELQNDDHWLLNDRQIVYHSNDDH